ncbi:MAG: hypothetical protein IJO40_02595 [Thermoguttaceae bacterium]|nr:hypothetical protein [Thermoguttaceae bacterium]
MERRDFAGVSGGKSAEGGAGSAPWTSASRKVDEVNGDGKAAWEKRALSVDSVK